MFGKYVIFDWPGKGEIPVVFPASILHGEISVSINKNFPGVHAVRAGLVELREEGIRCYGTSHSLKLKSDPIDNILIETMIKEL